MKTPLFIETGIPHWLQPPKLDRHPPFTEYTWEQFLDWIRGGGTLTSYCRENHNAPDAGRLRRWIHADPKRLDEYYEADAIGSGHVEDEMIDIADGMSDPYGMPSDVQRDALRINTRKWLLSVKNRARYGEKKQIDVGVTVDMGEVIQEARARVENKRQPALIENGEVVDG
jgi:hypothetical protein